MTQLVEHLTIHSLPPDFQPGGFSSGQVDVDDYMRTHAARDEAAGVTRSYLIKEGEELVAYVSVLCDAIRMARDERPTDHPGAPALKIGLMGVREDFRHGRRKFQERSLGLWILDWVVGLARSMAVQAGLRYVTLDALPEKKLVDWYERYGFRKNIGEDRARRIIKKEGSRKYEGKRLEDIDMPHVSMRLDILIQPTAALGLRPAVPATSAPTARAPTG